MRRSLVLTDEAARHPFRRSLPPHVCRAERPRKARWYRRITAEDLRHFLLAYCACFVAVSLYLA